jgi:uncharacterized protein Yka (UPF0111/DUF47 family)
MFEKIKSFFRSRKSMSSEISRLKSQRDRLRKELFIALKETKYGASERSDYLSMLEQHSNMTMEILNLRAAVRLAKDTIIANKWDVPRVLTKLKEALEKANV